MRPLSDELTAICTERKILKKDIAAEMGIDPAYLAQMVARGATVERIEQLTDAINKLDKSRGPRVKPSDFDRYVYSTIPELLAEDRTLLNAVRAVFYEMDPVERDRWVRSINPER